VGEPYVLLYRLADSSINVHGERWSRSRPVYERVYIGRESALVAIPCTSAAMKRWHGPAEWRTAPLVRVIEAGPATAWTENRNS